MWINGDGPFSQKAIAYAQGVLDGEIPACWQIKAAAKRFEADIDGDEWEFRPLLVEKACRFIQLLPHTKSVWASRRQLIQLEPWQVFCVAAIFGFVDPATGLRKVNEALLFIPRKNGKSTFAASIGLYMAFLDGEAGAEVWIGANSKDQADACFVPCQDMVRRSPKLMEACGIAVQAKSIFSASTGSFIKSMIGKPGDGSNPHCAILDEAHENDTSEQYDTMKTGMGSRLQPLLLTITTAGFNVAGPLRQLQVEAENVLKGLVHNDRLFAAIFTIDPEDDWTDFEVWKKANPNFGASLHEHYLRDQYRTAMDNPSKRAGLLTKHLNVWQNAASGWIDMRQWDACALLPSDGSPALTITDLKGSTAYLGLDLAAQIDLTALVVIVEHNGQPHIFPYFFLPQGAIEASKNAGAYRDWIARGFVRKTDGNATDFQAVYDTVLELMELLDVKGIVVDQWQALNTVQKLTDQFPDLEVLTFKQNPSEFNPVMREFEARLADGEIRHNANPCMDWMASNVCIKPTSNNLLKPFKPDRQAHLKIDGIVSALMALALYYTTVTVHTYEFAFA